MSGMPTFRSALRMLGLKDSLLRKYVLIVISALVLLPLSFPLISLVLNILVSAPDHGRNALYRNGLQLESMWHEEAGSLEGAGADRIDAELRRLQGIYAKAEMFWVDGDGKTRLKLPDSQPVRDVWDASYTVRFMKDAVNGDMFTSVAFIGEKGTEGFMVLKVPRSLIGPDRGAASLGRFTVGLIVVLALFMTLSLMFFYGIRSRIMRLQTAMTVTGTRGIPAPVRAARSDEIGLLEQAFNDMVGKLEAGREREASEEALRRDLIAKLSHDLRTPLTAIRGHAYSLGLEPLNGKAKESLALIDGKIEYVGRLIDNLLSYTLLSAGKYPYRPKRVDIVRMVKTQFAAWYPAFEQAGFEIDSELTDGPVVWHVDPQWMERVLDNYLQNVLRHAKTGRYVSLRVSARQGGRIEIEDRGPGLTAASGEGGAGIGLTIASLMLQEMKLRGEMRSGPEGTVVRIGPDAADAAASATVHRIAPESAESGATDRE